jgi:hypothetical protein
VDKAVSYISNKTNTKVAIEKMFLTFDGGLQLDGLYLEDKKGDTLVYSKSLEANIPLLAMIKGDAVGVDNLEWEGLRANIIRKDTVSGYNFQFLMDAFASQSPTEVVKDSTANPMNIIIGSVLLKDINVVFNDEVLGINSSYKVGKLEAEMEIVDIEKMIFSADDILMSDANIRYIQKPIVLTTPTEEIPLPILSANSITLKNVRGFYEAKADNIIADINLNEFYSEIPELNLDEKKYRLNDIQLKNSEVVIKMASGNSASVVESNQNSSSDILWPDITLEIDKINLENNKIGYFLDNAKLNKNKFNPNAISAENFNLKANDIFLKDKTGNLKIEEFNFQEQSGFKLNRFALNASITDKALAISDMNIKLNRSNLNGFAKVNYNSLSQLISSPENTSVQVRFSSFQIWLQELFKFQPALRKNEYLNKLSKKQLAGTLNVNGSLAQMNISNTNINWGKSTRISLDGTIKNATNPDLVYVNIPNFRAKTKRSDLLQIVDEKQLNIQLPEEILASGNIKGSLSAIDAAVKINTSQGIATINGKFKNKEIISYDVTANIDKYDIGKLLKNPQFGELSVTLKSKGSGDTINNLDATLTTNISKFQLNDYAIKDLEINGNIKDGKGDIASAYKDDNLNMKLKALVKLDSIASEANIDLNIIGADLAGLGLMKRNVKTGMEIDLDFKGNMDRYNIETSVKNGVVVYENRTYLVGLLNAKAFVDKDTTAVSIKNKMIDLDLESNTDPETFSKALQRHVFSYFYRDTEVSDTITNPVNLKLKGKIAQTRLIKDVFLVNVKDVDTINIGVDFNEKERKLTANITAPHINYSGNELDSLSFSMNTDKENFNFNLGFNNITAGPLDVPKTIISGNQNNNELSLNFSGIYKDTKLMNVNTTITGSRERLIFSVEPDNLILNKHSWNIPADNEVVLTENNLEFSNFKITKGNQSIEITDKLQKVSKSHVAIDYQNFKISEFFNYLNPKNEIAKGILGGDFILEEPFGDTGIIANLAISKLEVLKTNFGTLDIEGKSLGNSKYDFGAKLKGGDIDLDLDGDYYVSNDDANLDLDLTINEFKMKALNTLSLGEIKETSGSFSGDFKVSGTTSEPKYNGKLNFKNAEFNITKLNTKFTLKDETLNVDNSGLQLSKFTILDAKNNSLVLSGTIKTKTFINPKFNLDVRAKNFRVLNATQKDNPNLYGKAAFNADLKLTGDLQIPKLNAQLTLSPDTDVTYVLPATYANVEERDGVVVFVNRENPNAILTQTEEQTATITGFDIKAQLKVNRDAAVTVIINEDTGDNFRISGDGDFAFRMMPNGRLSLTGVYEVSEGHYELNLYGLVSRKFSLDKGSRVSWSGDPFDAKLDVRAIYSLETSASPLMASQISGEDSSIRNRYKQQLPFNVYLNIDGELLQPKISFNLDMPEEQQGAIGGQVFGRVQQVNQQEDELNRQVFSLLVLNRFYPDSGSDGSSGGFATIARDNLNDAVSGQLNAFSDKILGSSGIELDFGLNSFTDYQGDSPTDRTQLDVAAQKKLFNDRLTVRVGSEVDIQGSSPDGERTPLIGNVSLEYKVTEDGRYRLRGFRKSEFENVIDGQTIVSGIALIFTREFNEFNQLWDSIFRSQTKKKEEAERKVKEEIEKENNLENK